MTKVELTQLIILIYASERRIDAPSKAVVEAWHPVLAEVSFQDAQRAVLEHYGASDRPITLAQLREGSRRVLRGRSTSNEVSERTRVPDADPDDPKAFIGAMKDGRYLPDRDPEDFIRPALDVSSMGNAVPKAEEVDEKPVRPRRWWMKWSKGQEGTDEGK